MNQRVETSFLQDPAYATAAINTVREVVEQEVCADPVDHATRNEMQGIFASLASAAVQSKPQSHPDFDGAHCVNPDCGEAIPEKRLKAGRIYCVDCQEAKEAEAKRRGLPVWSVR